MAAAEPNRKSHWTKAVQHVALARFLVMGERDGVVEDTVACADDDGAAPKIRPRSRQSLESLELPELLESGADKSRRSPGGDLCQGYLIDAAAVATAAASSASSEQADRSKRASGRWKAAKAAISVARMLGPKSKVGVTSSSPTSSEDSPHRRLGTERKNMAGKISLTLHEEMALRDLFESFDHAKAQHITKDDYSIILQTFLDRHLSQEELTSMTVLANVDEDGMLSFGNFKATMASAVEIFNNSTPQDPPTALVIIGSAVSRMADNRRLGMQSPIGTGNGLDFGGSRNAFEAKKSEQHAAMIAHFKMRRLSVGVSSRSNSGRLVCEANSDPTSSSTHHGTESSSGEGTMASSANKTSWTGPWNPECWQKKAWDLVIMLIVVFQSLHIPFVVSFQPPQRLSWFVADLVFDVIFMTDLCFAFNLMTRVSPSQPWVTDRWDIARAYFKGWFAVDLIASIPLDLVIEGVVGAEASSQTAALGLLKAMRLPRLLRLLKILRVLRFSKLLAHRPEVMWWLQYSKHANIMRVFQMILMICLVLHYLACLFYVVVSNEQWMGMDLCDWRWSASARELRFQECSKASYYSRYIAAYYYALLLLQGEDIGPRSSNEKLYSTFAMLGGSILVAIIFGNVSILISNLSASSSAYHGKMEKLFNIMSHLDLPGPLRKRVVRYYEQIWSQYRSLDGHIRMFVPELNSSLRAEVYIYMRTNLILSVPFLRHCSPDVVKELVMCLREEVHLQGDYIMHKGTLASAMFCVSHGYCEVTHFASEPKADAPVTPALAAGERDRSSGRRSALRLFGTAEKPFAARMAVAPAPVDDLLSPPSTPTDSAARKLASRRGSICGGFGMLPGTSGASGNQRQQKVEKVLKVLVEGDYFGDIVLVLDC